MKILQVIPTLNSGGAEKLVVDLSIQLRKMGNEVEVLSLFNQYNTIFKENILNNGVEFNELNKKSGFDISCLIKIYKFIKKSNPDIIHCHLDSIKYVAIVSYILNKKTIYTFHNIADKDAIGINVKILKFIFKYLKVKPIAICNKVKVSAIKLYGKEMDEIPIIYNGVDSDLIDKVKVKEEVGINILNVATFKEQKNHKFLIDVMQKVNNVNKSIKLYLVGDGPLKDEMINYVEEKKLTQNIFFLGDRKDVYNLMKKYKNFVLLSKYEGFSIAILEAMACKMKILVSDVGGNSEQITNNENGILIKKENAEVVALKIIDMINFNGDYGENAYLKVKNNFDITITASRYNKIYNEF